MRDIKGEFFCIVPKWKKRDELTSRSLFLYKISMRNTMQFVHKDVIIKKIMSTIQKEQLTDFGFLLTVSFSYSHNSKFFDCKDIVT